MANNLIWENTLDGIYRCYVLAQTDTYGYLRVEVIETGERLLDREVATSKYFRHRDIIEWGDMCMQAVLKHG